MLSQLQDAGDAVLPGGSALTLQFSSLGLASWLRLGLSLVPKLWVRRGALHRMPENLVPGCFFLPVTLLKVLPI